MCALMGDKIIMFLENPTTDVALINILKMFFLVVAQVTRQQEICSTDLARAAFALAKAAELSWALTSVIITRVHDWPHLTLVHSHVVEQVSFFSKGLLAVVQWAVKRLLSSLKHKLALNYTYMDPRVNFQPASPWISLVAAVKVADKWFLTSMSQLMRL